jgi:hypothetical protein
VVISSWPGTKASTNRRLWVPKPEVHEDFGIHSYDRALKRIVLRQFHGEAFVNEYTLDSVSPETASPWSLQPFELRISLRSGSAEEE